MPTVTLDFEKPTAVQFVGDMSLIVAWMRSGYSLMARSVCKGIHVWMDAPSPTALDLNPADVARLITAGLIEEDRSKETDFSSTYMLTAAGLSVQL